MKIHFICRGNVLRSFIAETYLRSLELPGVDATSSGTVVNLASQTEREFFANTLAVLRYHGIEKYAKDTSDQLTQKRVDGQDITICMNQRVFEEAQAIVALPQNTLVWAIVDIGEGHRTDATSRESYEEEIFREIVAEVKMFVKQKGLL